MNEQFPIGGAARAVAGPGQGSEKLAHGSGQERPAVVVLTVWATVHGSRQPAQKNSAKQDRFALWNFKP